MAPGGAAFVGAPAFGVDGVLDVDGGAMGGSLVFSGNATSATEGDTVWAVDMGGGYNLTVVQVRGFGFFCEGTENEDGAQ